MMKNHNICYFFINMLKNYLDNLSEFNMNLIDILDTYDKILNIF